MNGFFLEAASSYAQDIDNLILLILVLVGFWFFLAEFIFFYFIWKFRDREGHTGAMHITGNEKEYKKWINIPHGLVLLCDVFIIVGSVRVWYNVKQELPEADREVRVIGQQWAWSFQHPGADGKLDTADDIFTVDTLHVEVDKTYHVKMVSKDVLHSFSIPAFRLKQDIVPGRTITGWFKPTSTGTFDLQCAEMCGIGHGIMAAKVVIEDAEGHSKWVTANTSVASNGAQ